LAGKDIVHSDDDFNDDDDDDDDDFVTATPQRLKLKSPSMKTTSENKTTPSAKELFDSDSDFNSEEDDELNISPRKPKVCTLLVSYSCILLLQSSFLLSNFII
jgi:hypothetical protein